MIDERNPSEKRHSAGDSQLDPLSYSSDAHVSAEIAGNPSANAGATTRNRNRNHIYQIPRGSQIVGARC